MEAITTEVALMRLLPEPQFYVEDLGDHIIVIAYDELDWTLFDELEEHFHVEYQDGLPCRIDGMATRFYRYEEAQTSPDFRLPKYKGAQYFLDLLELEEDRVFGKDDVPDVMLDLP